MSSLNPLPPLEDLFVLHNDLPDITKEFRAPRLSHAPQNPIMDTLKLSLEMKRIQHTKIFHTSLPNEIRKEKSDAECIGTTRPVSDLTHLGELRVAEPMRGDLWGLAVQQEPRRQVKTIHSCHT
jgi:hypothetical protein